jgi:predicted RecB family nuclease
VDFANAMLQPFSIFAIGGFHPTAHFVFSVRKALAMLAGRRDGPDLRKGPGTRTPVSRITQGEGRYVAEIAGEGFDLPERTALTRELMQAGAEVICLAALVVPPWLGFADFLERVDEVSDFGPWSYEALDTKLPRRAKPEHVIQVTTYSKLIGIEQGRTPTEMHVQLGNNERISLRVADFAHYHSIAERRLGDIRKPITRVFCRGAMWSLSHLPLVGSLSDRLAADHLTLVANITRHQIRRLWDARISTVRTLTALPVSSRVPGIQPETCNRLRHQATLQIVEPTGCVLPHPRRNANAPGLRQRSRSQAV